MYQNPCYNPHLQLRVLGNDRQDKSTQPQTTWGIGVSKSWKCLGERGGGYGLTVEAAAPVTIEEGSTDQQYAVAEALAVCVIQCLQHGDSMAITDFSSQ